MPASTPFRLNRSGLLLALISTAFAGQVQAAAGRVEFAIGPVTVVGTDGRTRPAARGTELDTGDTVQTNNGRVQVRMTDGAFISLQPNTEFGIKDYKFAGKADGSENALYSLFKGAMRTVTGVIGRTNRNRYQVATPTATVGIRGTGGLIQVQNDGSTLVQGTSGIWFLANPAGSIDIPAGVAGIAPVDPKQPPKETVQIPTAGPSPLPMLIEFVQGEERGSDGQSVLTPSSPTGALPSGTGYATTVFYGSSEDGTFAEWIPPFQGAATFDGSGQLTRVGITESEFGVFFELAGGTHADFGSDGTIAWGRWIGPVRGDYCGDGCIVNENYTANQGFHYVIGMPTVEMPLVGQATYSLLGATRPTYVDGSTAPGTLTGSLSVDFAALSVGLTLNVAMPDTSYAIRGSVPIFNNFFIGCTFCDSNFVPTVTGGNCGGACGFCDVTVAGFFAGANAERAGLGYHITDSPDFSSSKEVIGTAAFQKQ